MKLSEDTIKFLENFSIINQGLIVKKGSVIRTLAANQNIMAQAEVEEVFDVDFAIYDLTKTLALLSMNKKDPQIELHKDHITFSGAAGKGKIRQRYSVPNLIAGYDKVDREIKINDFEADITLTEETHKWILSVASILKCPNIVIRSVDAKQIEIVAEDVKGAIVDDATCAVDGTATGEFQAVLKIENLKIIPGNYKIQISSKGISKFTHADKKIFYWIPLEKEASKFTS